MDKNNNNNKQKKTQLDVKQYDTYYLPADLLQFYLYIFFSQLFNVHSLI